MVVAPGAVALSGYVLGVKTYGWGSFLPMAPQTAAGFAVLPVPGPSAVAALWSVSGLEGPFTFVGFLPQRHGERRRALAALAGEPRPLIFYEIDDQSQDQLAQKAEACASFLRQFGYTVNGLPDSYSHLEWNINHFCATPQ